LSLQEIFSNENTAAHTFKEKKQKPKTNKTKKTKPTIIGKVNVMD